MSPASEPRFLTRELVLLIHHRSLMEHGGTDGIRDNGAIESALAAGQNEWCYRNADVFGIAAAYAFHMAEAQAFLDGNKRTAIVCALFFLAANGINGTPGQMELYNA